MVPVIQPVASGLNSEQALTPTLSRGERGPESGLNSEQALTPTLSRGERGPESGLNSRTSPSPQPSPGGRGGRSPVSIPNKPLTPTLSRGERGSEGAYSRLNRGASRSIKARKPSWKSAVCMQWACVMASISRAASRPIPASRSEQLLRDPDGEPRPVLEPASQSQRLRHQLLVGHDLVRQADPVGFRGVDGVPQDRSSMARPRPTIRGSRWMAPMSDPARPTLTNRKASLARSDRMRKSLARARAAPAPAAIPFTAAIMGFLQPAHVAHEVAGEPREAVQPRAVHLQQLADDVVDAASGAEALARAGEHHDVHPAVVGPASRSAPPTPRRSERSGR